MNLRGMAAERPPKKVQYLYQTEQSIRARYHSDFYHRDINVMLE